jgi:hypothetical protein
MGYDKETPIFGIFLVKILAGDCPLVEGFHSSPHSFKAHARIVLR